jgi:hypothetical protein
VPVAALENTAAVATPDDVVRVTSHAPFSKDGSLAPPATQPVSLKVTDVLSGTFCEPLVTLAVSRIAVPTSAELEDGVREIEYDDGVGDGGGAVGLLVLHATPAKAAASARARKEWARLMVVSRIPCFTDSRRRS